MTKDDVLKKLFKNIGGKSNKYTLLDELMFIKYLGCAVWSAKAKLTRLILLEQYLTILKKRESSLNEKDQNTVIVRIGESIQFCKGKCCNETTNTRCFDCQQM